MHCPLRALLICEHSSFVQPSSHYFLHQTGGLSTPTTGLKPTMSRHALPGRQCRSGCLKPRQGSCLSTWRCSTHMSAPRRVGWLQLRRLRPRCRAVARLAPLPLAQSDNRSGSQSQFSKLLWGPQQNDTGNPVRVFGLESCRPPPHGLSHSHEPHQPGRPGLPLHTDPPPATGLREPASSPRNPCRRISRPPRAPLDLSLPSLRRGRKCDH